MTEESQTEGTAEFTPERWETAIEDAAEVVALLLDRGQALFDGFAELRRTRPLVVAAAGAALGGAVLGTVLAGRWLQRRKRHPMNAVAQASEVAQAAAERLAQRQVLRGAKRIADLRDGVRGAHAQGRLVEGGRTARQLVQLLPVVVAVLKNPLVRTMLWRFALRSVRR